MKEIKVGLDERSYPIIIKAELLDEVGSMLKRNPFAKGMASLQMTKLLSSLVRGF
jgi:hypothetical protein